jgi:hypothetical protein
MSAAIQLRPSAMLFFYPQLADYEPLIARTEKRANCIRRYAINRLASQIEGCVHNDSQALPFVH